MAYPDDDDLAAAGLALAVDGVVLRVTLARPEARNPQTPATWRALAAIGAAVDDSIRVVVVSGRGESFSAGLDRRMLTPGGLVGEPSFAALAAMPDEQALGVIEGFQRGFGWLADPRFVSVAGVRGAAVGAGFQLALACDLRVLGDDARLSMRETSLGLVPDLTGTQRLVQTIGYERALEICLTGRWVGAEEAHEYGLATTVVPSDALDAAVDDLATALTRAPAAAARATQTLLCQAGSRSATDQWRAERVAQLARLRDLAGADDEDHILPR